MADSSSAVGGSLFARSNPSLGQISVVGLACASLACLGALTFVVLERDAALESRNVYKEQLEDLIMQGNFSVGQEAIINNIIEHHGSHWCMPHMAHDDPWNFKSSLYFTVVLISTVGYGDLAPETFAGKIAAVLVSLIGIPLLLSFTVPLARRLIGAITGVAQRAYVARSVTRAMEAVELMAGGTGDGGKIKVDYRRRVPSIEGIGLSQDDLRQVELVSMLLLLSLILATIAGLTPLLMVVEGWTAEDALGFVWYTLTTIGLGDKTMDLTHPTFAVCIIVMVLLLGTAAAQALMNGMQRAAEVVEKRVGADTWALDDVLTGLRKRSTGVGGMLGGEDEESDETWGLLSPNCGMDASPEKRPNRTAR